MDHATRWWRLRTFHRRVYGRDARVSDTYVDVRSFRPSDFLNHRGVVEAMMKSGQQELVDSLAADAVKNEVKARLPGDEK